MGTIVLMEPHPLLRLGLWQILRKLDGGWDLVEMESYDARGRESVTGGVDFLIYGMPFEGSGWTLLAEIHRELEPARILLLTDGGCMLPPGLALADLPVCGCVQKTVSVEILEAAIRLVIAGGHCFPGCQQAEHLPSALELRGGGRAMVSTCPSSLGLADGGVARGAIMADDAQRLHLTPRQYEVLVLLARGYPIKTISRMLNISVATAKTHACTLYQRLQVRNKGEAVYTALQRGATLEWSDSEMKSQRISSVAHK